MKTIKDHELPRQSKFRRKMKSPSLKTADNLDKKNKYISPDRSSRSLCYGVLGIGRFGSTLVINLVKIGKKVYIWNRNDKKCKNLLQNLDRAARSYVEICHIPSLVIQRSDIIFNCISDCHGSKGVVKNSLSKEFAPDNFMVNKGLIDMSGLDPEGQEEMSTLVENKGGKYLEVRIQFREELIGGGYLFLVGGDEDLFTVCKSCFSTLGGTALYLGENIGYVTKLNIILQLIKSTCLLGVTEGFSLLERMVPLDAQTIMPVFFTTPIASDYVKSKALMIFCKKFDLVEQSLQNLGKDIQLGMEISNNVSEPMFLPSLVDQILKHSQKLGYGNVDPSAVFMRVRH